MLIGSAKVKDAVSSLPPVLLPTQSTTISAPVLQEDALLWVEVVVLALLILDLMVASSFILTLTTIAIILVLPAMLDSPPSNLSEEPLTASASKELCQAAAVPPNPLSASSTAALVLAPALSLLLPSEPRL